MKNSLKTFKVFVTGVWMFAFSLSFLFSSANNIRINGTVQVTQGTGDTLVLSFPLRWDNSWRDQFNWDAAWVFFKYKSGTGGCNHVNLCAGGHRFTDGSGRPVPFESMAGNTGSNTVGLFIYRNMLEAGNTPEINCQMKCLKSSLGGLTAEKFTSHEGFVLAQAVEMVYVPYGAHYLGDGGCSNRFAGGSDGSPVLIDGEEAITASTATKVYPITNNITGSVQNIAAVYPKGYKGFYMMKYEVSQEQWVYFLNTLTYAQQRERVPELSALKGGDYIFGSKSIPNNRNGIVVAEPSYGSNAVIFANNLNNNAVYSEDGDGKTIACNNLSPSDMVAYCSWAGLRPMSELEYEKACRSSYPEQPVKGEYAWHDNGITGRLSGVSNSGMRNERSGTVNANVNAGNGFGPVRCGLFATGSSTQQSAGAAFWGGMELSGNVKELCYNLSYTGFNGSTLGTGAYNTALWSVTPAHFGVKGGGFSSADSLLRVSDRTEIVGYFADINKRDSTVGFRGVRTIGSETTIIQGKIIAKQNGGTITGTACPDIQLDLTTDAEAKVMSGSNEVANMAISYVWYVLKPGATVDSIIPGATGAMLSYHDLKVTGISASETYKFRRKAICPVGESLTDYITFIIPNMNLTLSTGEVFLDICNISDRTVTATVPGGSSFGWYCKDNLLPVSDNSYIADRGHFGEEAKPGGDFEVTCRYTRSGCQVERDILVHVAPDNLTCPANVQDKDGNVYPVVKIGGCQCWMGKNLNVGTYEVGDYWKFDEDGIQKWCYGDSEANCAAYGGLYEWWEAVCGGKCNGTSPVTPSNAQGLNLNSEADLVAYGAKMLPGSTTRIQGICPDGWRMPSDRDWQALEIQLGMSSSDAGTTGWRGTDQDTKMKIPGTFNGYNWCSGDNCNASGLGLLPGGCRYEGTFYDLGRYGSWWSSTPGDTYAWMRQLYYGYAAVNRNNHDRSFNFSIRCVKN